MILRFDSNKEKDISQNEIYILEATAQIGVRVKRWSDMKKHVGTFYKRVVLRHLEFKRTEDSLTKLE